MSLSIHWYLKQQESQHSANVTDDILLTEQMESKEWDLHGWYEGSFPSFIIDKKDAAATITLTLINWKRMKLNWQDVYVDDVNGTPDVCKNNDLSSCFLKSRDKEQ